MVALRILLIAPLILTSGCGFIKHLDELSVLGDIVRDKDNQNKSIKLNNENYDALLLAIETKQMGNFVNQNDVSSRFGQPIAVKEIEVDGQKIQQWLYRYAILKEAKDRIYLYFDAQGKLLRYEREEIQWF